MNFLEACGVFGAISPVIEIGTKRFGSWQRSTDTVNACEVAVLALASDHGAAEVVFPGMDPSHLPVFLVGLALGAKLVVQLLKPLVVWDSNAIILVCSRPLSLPAVFQTSKQCYREHRSKRMSQDSAEVQFSFDFETEISPSILVLARFLEDGGCLCVDFWLLSTDSGDLWFLRQCRPLGR